MRGRLIRIGAAVAVLGALAGGGVAWATAGDEDDDAMVTGRAAEQARTAALAHAGGGRVTGVEREDEDGAAWEVEVKRADGSTLEVMLDANYKVVSAGVDDEEDEAEPGDDD
jgi:uncharacterized membrane protein YkoI